MTGYPGYPERLLGLLDGSAGLPRDRPVFETGPRVVTAAELLDLVARIATGLRHTGIGPGDGVGLVLGVTPDALAATIAGHVVGARVSGVRPDLPLPALRHVLGRGQAAVLVDPGTASASVHETAGDAALLALGRVPGLPDLTAVRPDADALRCTANADDPARVVFTSGSTGRPKGCVQTYRGLAAGWAADPDAWPPVIRELAAGLQRYLVFGTLSSLVMSEYGVITLAAGGTLVAADPPDFPAAWARLRATSSVITVPRLHQVVAAQRRDPVDLGALRVLMVSGSPLDPRRLAEALDVLGPVVFHGYGQTETGMISMAGPAELLRDPAALDSVGSPPPGTSVRVRGADGAELPDGEVGELDVRTPNQSAGYLDDPGLTAEVFAGGWVRTRDLGFRDAAGRLHLVGRARDVVIVNAELVHPGPVERLLATHPDVTEAYVVGAPSERSGEALHAFVVLRDGGHPDEAALRALVAADLGPAAVPETFTPIDAVPLGPGGKPDRQALVAGLGPTGSAGRAARPGPARS